MFIQSGLSFAKYRVVMNHVFVMVFCTAAFCGCGGKPSLAQINEVQIAALQTHREAFEAVAHGDISPTIKEHLKLAGVVKFQKVGRCIEFRWRLSSSLDSQPVMYYAPDGRQDLPEGFWESGPWYSHAMEVNPNWFVARLE